MQPTLWRTVIVTLGALGLALSVSAPVHAQDKKPNILEWHEVKRGQAIVSKWYVRRDMGANERER